MYVRTYIHNYLYTYIYVCVCGCVFTHTHKYLTNPSLKLLPQEQSLRTEWIVTHLEAAQVSHAAIIIFFSVTFLSVRHQLGIILYFSFRVRVKMLDRAEDKLWDYLMHYGKINQYCISSDLPVSLTAFWTTWSWQI